jgi:hypothetical protein
METKFKVGDEFYAYSNRGCFLPYTVMEISINIKIDEEDTLTEVRYEAVSNTVGVKEHRMIDEDEAFNKEDLKEMLERVIERIQDKAQLPE